MSRTFGEDITVVEAQQRRRAGGSGKPNIDVTADAPTIQARVVLARMIAEEQGGDGKRAVA
jgi:hypothetical protein